MKIYLDHQSPFQAAELYPFSPPIPVELICRSISLHEQGQDQMYPVISLLLILKC